MQGHAHANTAAAPLPAAASPRGCMQCAALAAGARSLVSRVCARPPCWVSTALLLTPALSNTGFTTLSQVWRARRLPPKGLRNTSRRRGLQQGGGGEGRPGTCRFEAGSHLLWLEEEEQRGQGDNCQQAVPACLCVSCAMAALMRCSQACNIPSDAVSKISCGQAGQVHCMD